MCKLYFFKSLLGVGGAEMMLETSQHRLEFSGGLGGAQPQRGQDTLGVKLIRACVPMSRFMVSCQNNLFLGQRGRASAPPPLPTPLHMVVLRLWRKRQLGH